QAFEPVLIEGKAIQLHPLVCTAFNADFDGDQMAVHVPLSVEAQLEAKVLMMSTNNILSPAHGRPIMTPTQDMVLGLYWMTREAEGVTGEGKTFATPEDVEMAYDHGKVDLHARIRMRVEGEVVTTTVGRVLLWAQVPKAVPFSYVNRLLKKKELGTLVDASYRLAGNVETVRMLDELKRLGFMHATKAGFSISINDMAIPEKKEPMLQQAQKDVLEVRQQYVDGLITEGERYNKVIDIWARLTDQVADAMLDNLRTQSTSKAGNVNSIFVMADSGARGSTQQLKQLAGMRGLMAKPSGEIIETPITANFREGLSVLQYFISTHGARKGLADTALKTANSGYLTRRLVDVAQDGVITAEDCGTVEGIEMTALIEAGEIIETLGERVLGRVALEDIVDPYRNVVLAKAGDEIDEDKAHDIENAGIEKVRIRSVLTCMMEHGVCSMCYGRDLARGRMVALGEAVGVIAAQSIGEPGTQLTMRTFHIGGAASQRAEVSKWESKFSGTLDYSSARVVKNRDGHWIIMNRKAEARVIDAEGREVEVRSLPVGSMLLKDNGAVVKRGETIAEWDPFSVPILSDVGGTVKFTDIIDGVTMRDQLDKDTGLSRRVILDSAESDSRPEISIRDSKGHIVKSTDIGQQARFFLPAKAELMVEDGQEISAGTVLAKMPREMLRNRDITGGLPRVAELFEARIPKEPSIISEIDGVVTFGKDVKRKQKLIVTPEHGEPKEYLIPRGKHIIVHENDYVRAGEPIVDGPANPHDILAVLGTQELQKYLVDEVQEVYRLQGVSINDKHIEVIVRQMLKQVKIVDPGGTTFLINEQVSRYSFDRANQETSERGAQPATAKPVLQGITKAALSTESFISAASFQETTKVLTEAAINCKVDS
ncbi:MAG TPA: DNA-directed RNA polymerase subunit beta', partial [bacterium]|nr:DNA-directed RNA polymerase subunit beta' [bacterium]